MQYTVSKTGQAVWSVFDGDGDEIGRVASIKGSYHAKHSLRHEGAFLASFDMAVEAIVAIELLINARFADQVEIVGVAA